MSDRVVIPGFLWRVCERCRERFQSRSGMAKRCEACKRDPEFKEEQRLLRNAKCREYDRTHRRQRCA